MTNKTTFQHPPPALKGRSQPQPRRIQDPSEIFYPSEDGNRMADDTWQAHVMTAMFTILTTRYVDDPNVFVSLDLLMYYTEGVPEDVLAPDVSVTFGIPDKHRYYYKVWVEGKVPDFVLEVSSDKSYKDHLGEKKCKYERLGVPEYCVIDPKGGLHWPRLQLFRLEGGAYRRVSGRGDPDSPLALPSEALDLELRFEGDRFRLWDPKAGEYLLENHEERAGHLRERARYAAAEQRAESALRQTEAESPTLQELEAEVARLEGLLRRQTESPAP